MASDIAFQPREYHTVTPFLVVKGAAAALDFYERALGAKVVVRIAGPDGTVGHAEIQIGDSRIAVSDEFPEAGLLSAQTIGGSPTLLHVYVPDVDAATRKAVAAGARVVQDVADRHWGDRSGRIVDPFGYAWTLATHVEDVPPDELIRRGEACLRDDNS